MNTTRFLRKTAVTATVGLALLFSAGAAEAAHAEMTDPPTQADIESSGGGYVGSLGTPGGGGSYTAGSPGSVPVSGWMFDGMAYGVYFYSPTSAGTPVTQGAVDYFNSAKGGGCALTSSQTQIVCAN
ncbi:hypothetical protein [Subtercola boreus]|uniref:hypothetical protein n=1 Tax=Subtercola boreus TaxID=120213 RepID=UPI00115384F7|nr:hypothetical protein [Subtercola boreus]TQL55282.1 hypothetical protein FB464_2845 [Subtercola boreus]